MFRNYEGQTLKSMDMVKIHVVDDAEQDVQAPLTTADGRCMVFWTKVAGLQAIIDNLPSCSSIPFYRCITIEVHARMPVLDIALSKRVLCLRRNAAVHSAVNAMPVYVILKMSDALIHSKPCTLSPTFSICDRRVGIQSPAAVARQLHRDGVCQCAEPHTFELHGIGYANTAPRTTIPLVTPLAPPPEDRPRTRSRGIEPFPAPPSPALRPRPRAHSTGDPSPRYNDHGHSYDRRASRESQEDCSRGISRETAVGPVPNPAPHQYQGYRSRSMYPDPERILTFASEQPHSFRDSDDERYRTSSGPVRVPGYNSGDRDEDWGANVDRSGTSDDLYIYHDDIGHRNGRSHSRARSTHSAPGPPSGIWYVNAGRFEDEDEDEDEDEESDEESDVEDRNPGRARTGGARDPAHNDTDDDRDRRYRRDRSRLRSASNVPRPNAGRDADEDRNAGRGRPGDTRDSTRNDIDDGQDHRRSRSHSRGSQASRVSGPSPTPGHRSPGCDQDGASNVGRDRPINGGLHENWRPREHSRSPSPLPSFQVIPPPSTSPSTVVSYPHSQPGVQIIFVNSRPSTPGTPDTIPGVFINPIVCSHRHDYPPSSQGILDN